MTLSRALAPLLVASVASAGCAGIRTMRYTLAPAPNACQATETRVTAFSTVAVVVCWDATGQVIGMASARGEPVAALGTAAIGAAGTIMGAAVLGGALLGTARIVSGTKLVPDHVDVTVRRDPLADPSDLARQLTGSK